MTAYKLRAVYLFVVFLLFIVSYSQPAATAGYVEECYGCHTPARVKPIDGLFPNGFGHWRDSQCYGCHREINDVAINVHKGLFDKRRFALPVSKSRLSQLSHSPLSYMNAPQQLIFSVNDIPRFSPKAFFDFLRQPVSLNKFKVPYTTMLAYPKLTKQQFNNVINELNNNQVFPDSAFTTVTADTKQALKVWNQQCKSCHESTIAPYDKQGLSLFSADWIYHFTNGLLEKPDSKRTMPIIKVNKATAKGLQQLFTQSYQKAKQRINQRIKTIVNKPLKNSTKLNDKAISYIWDRFFRDGMCVHCHGIEGRAKQYFDATNQTTISQWLGKNSPWKIWRRLEIRTLEVETEIQALSPGMPMAAPALPKPMRQLFVNWIGENCPDLSGKNHCNENK
ncbi:hypothetical protein H0A36_12315 [Endozoicomonas sp. SM1973]|uniref:Cytochrome c-552/4 domain-containing protein n=1 Tax=Spartinivicinus marinus TaxID=2994442 RepID=A0A853IGV3_9GAMM|nr:hypothetical protein [Spartinivicinus marinus]MCX4026858.1 hypothetical protein [Spartinivicinus marinus]NYZ66796.1 hypothetical protein [Spartinivicinus marinus]